jgi:hypothetical protein
MKRRYAAIVAGALAGMISMAVLAAGSSDWAAIKSPNELRALYSNKTFTGKGPIGNTFVGYYRSDGRGWSSRTTNVYRAHGRSRATRCA